MPNKIPQEEQNLLYSWKYTIEHWMTAVQEELKKNMAKKRNIFLHVYKLK